MLEKESEPFKPMILLGENIHVDPYEYHESHSDEVEFEKALDKIDQLTTYSYDTRLS